MNRKEKGGGVGGLGLSEGERRRVEEAFKQRRACERSEEAAS